MPKYFLILLILTLIATTGRAAVYKWVDEKGTTYFSDSPPPGKKVKEVELPPLPSMEAPEKTQRKLSRQVSPELLRAIESGDAERALALLRQGADPNTRDQLGRTALMYAGINGQTRVIMRALLQGGADLNAKSSDGTTALIASVVYGDPEAVRLLLSSGADVNARDHMGQTALKLANERLRTAPADRSFFPNMPERNQYGDLTFVTKQEMQKTIELLKKAGAKE